MEGKTEDIPLVGTRQAATPAVAVIVPRPLARGGRLPPRPGELHSRQPRPAPRELGAAPPIGITTALGITMAIGITAIGTATGIITTTTLASSGDSLIIRPGCMVIPTPTIMAASP